MEEPRYLSTLHQPNLAPFTRLRAVLNFFPLRMRQQRPQLMSKDLPMSL